MAMVTLAGFVVVPHHAPAIMAAVESVLDTMRPIGRLPWQCPDHHFHNHLTLSIFVPEKLPRPHNGLACHNALWCQGGIVKLTLAAMHGYNEWMNADVDR
jgi:hypothetical protein